MTTDDNQTCLPGPTLTPNHPTTGRSNHPEYTPYHHHHHPHTHKMLPTPTTSHLSFNHIYEQNDDTFLLLNTLTPPIPLSTLPLSANLLPPSSPRTRQRFRRYSFLPHNALYRALWSQLNYDPVCRNFSARSEDYEADCCCQSHQGEWILSRGYKDGFSDRVEVRSGGYAGV